MYKNLKLAISTALLLTSSLIVNAQKVINEGTIVYNVQYDLPPDKQAMAGMLPSEYKMEFKNGLSKFKMDMGMFSTSVIYNATSQESLSLTEIPMQNKKIAMQMNKEQGKKMMDMQNGEKDYEVKETTDTKTLAGYTCKKYVYTDKISGDTMDVWVTNDIKLPTTSFTAVFTEVKGTPLQFETNSRGMKSTLTAKEVKEGNVADISMTIPEGFEKMSFEEVMQQMGG